MTTLASSGQQCNSLLVAAVSPSRLEEHGVTNICLSTIQPPYFVKTRQLDVPPLKLLIKDRGWRNWGSLC